MPTRVNSVGSDSVRTHTYGTMEVLLLQDVAGVGKKNDVLVVGDGFALNCLLPERKALVATPTVRKRYADQIRKRAEEKEHEKKAQLDSAAAIAGKSVSFKRKATKTGKLYAAVSADDIAAGVLEQLSVQLKPSNIVINEPVKAIGTTSVQVRVGDQQYPLTVEVKQEK